MHYFTQNASNILWGEPPPRHHPHWGGGTPLPRTYPYGAYGASIKFIPPNQIPGYALSNTIDQGTGPPPNFEDVVAPLVTDGSTDGQTNRQNYDSQDLASIAASRGKKLWHVFVHGV